MGNSSLYGVSRHRKNLGMEGYAAVDVKETEDMKTNERKWNVLLTVDGSNSALDLKCLSGTDGKVREVIFELSGDAWSGGGIKFRVRKTQKDLLRVTPVETPSNSGHGHFSLHTSANQNINARGGGKKCTNWAYLKGRKGGRGLLVIMELKRKSEDEGPYKLTVAHYYAIADGGNNSRPAGTDIGLSVIAKIQVSNDVGLDIVVEQGPEEHPAKALFIMFEEVTKTGIWKPTLCSHCADIQKQLAAADMSSQSGDEDNDNFPPPRHGQNAQRTVNNSGAFGGNGNGSHIGGNFTSVTNNIFGDVSSVTITKNIFNIFVTEEKFPINMVLKTGPDWSVESVQPGTRLQSGPNESQPLKQGTSRKPVNSKALPMSLQKATTQKKLSPDRKNV